MNLRRPGVKTVLTVLFFLALLALGLCTAADYGQPWDEPWEQDILRLNYNQFAELFGSDERLAMVSSIDVPAGGLIENSIEKDHGICAYYPLFPLVSNPAVAPLQRMTLWHMYTWLWFVLGAAALFGIARGFGLSTAGSCAAALFLVLTPRFFAQGHYNNKDMILVSLVLLLLYCTMKLVDRPTALRALPFAAVGAMAANTKIIGLFLYGLCALAVFVPMLRKRGFAQGRWAAALIAVPGFLALWLALTPAAWNDPLGFLTYSLKNAVGFSRWDHYVLFRGTVYHLAQTRLPRDYLPYMIAVTTPLWLLLLMGAGQVFALRDLLRVRKQPLPKTTAWMLTVCTAAWAVPLLFVVIGRPTLYNGWRHYYFLGAPLLCLAAYGLKRGADFLRGRCKPVFRRIAAAALAIVMTATGVFMALNHPMQYTYYNALLAGRDVPQYMELDYWNVSVLPALRNLLRVTDGEFTVTGADYWSQYGLEAAFALLAPDEQTRVGVLAQGSANAGYVLSNPMYRHFSHWSPAGRSLYVSAEGYGWPICEIYRNP